MGGKCFDTFSFKVSFQIKFLFLSSQNLKKSLPLIVYLSQASSKITSLVLQQLENKVTTNYIFNLSKLRN